MISRRALCSFVRRFEDLMSPGQTFICKRCKYSEPSWRAEAKSKPGGIGKYITLVIPVAALGLGTWQIERRKWKIDLIKTMEEKTEADPVPLPENLDDLKDMAYRKISVRGRFHHDRELYVIPRSPVEDSDGDTRKRGPTVGAHIITPFTLSDRNLTILVNRGWVPKKMENPATRKEGQIQGEVDLTGVYRTSEKRQPFAVENDPARNQWFYRDVEKMAEFAGTSPVFLDAVRDNSVAVGPIGGQTRVALRNEHLSYIITWYTLAAITGIMWYIRFIR